MPVADRVSHEQADDQPHGSENGGDPRRPPPHDRQPKGASL
jgi:hypothetical protein